MPISAELVRVTQFQVDIKIVSGEAMHVLQWRRRLLLDEVLLDGVTQQTSYGLWGREKVYGLVFGKDVEGNGGKQVMLLVDPRNSDEWFGTSRKLAGIRLETHDGPLVTYGSLDPKTLQKPDTFSDWMKKTMGMEWGDRPRHGPH